MNLSTMLREKRTFFVLGTVLVLIGIVGASIAWIRRVDPHLLPIPSPPPSRSTILCLVQMGSSLPPRQQTARLRYVVWLDGSVIRTFHGHSATGLRSATSSLAFSPDGQHLVSAGQDQTINLWNLETGQPALIWNNTPDWPYALTSPRPPDGVLVAQYEPFASVAFSPDGSLIAVGTERGRVVIIEKKTLAVIWVIQANTLDEMHSLPVNQVAVSPDNQLVVSVGEEVQGMSGGMKLWHIPEGQIIRHIVKPTPTGNHYSPDWAAFRSNEPSILTLDFARYVSKYHGYSGVGTIRLGFDRWSLDGQRLPTLPELTAQDPEICPFNGDAYPTSFALSADARLAAWGGGSAFHENLLRFLGRPNDPRIIVWHVGAPQPITILKGHQDNVADLAFSPDNSLLASVSAWDHTLRLWQLND